MKIRPVLPNEWPHLRELRLQALADSPAAFGSTLAQEKSYLDSVWQERAAAGVTNETRITYIVEAEAAEAASADASAGSWLGSATGVCTVSAAGETIVSVVGVWVNPGVRGRRLGERLLAAIATWAAGRGAEGLDLWVTATNAPAIALYQRCGFRDTGERTPLPHTPSLAEMRMHIPLQDLPPLASG